MTCFGPYFTREGNSFPTCLWYLGFSVTSSSNRLDSSLWPCGTIICMHACMHAKSLQSCPTLCNLIDGSPTGSSVPGILQARIPVWVAISFSKACMHAKPLQSCLTLCNPIDSSPLGFSVHRILQARILEWVATVPVY